MSNTPSSRWLDPPGPALLLHVPRFVPSPSLRDRPGSPSRMGLGRAGPVGGIWGARPPQPRGVPPCPALLLFHAERRERLALLRDGNSVRPQPSSGRNPITSSIPAPHGALPLKWGVLLGPRALFPLPKLVKALPCPGPGLGERRGPGRVTPPWLFIAAIKFGGAAGDAPALPSRCAEGREGLREGLREGVRPVPALTARSRLVRAGDKASPGLPGATTGCQQIPRPPRAHHTHPGAGGGGRCRICHWGSLRVPVGVPVMGGTAAPHPRLPRPRGVSGVPSSCPASRHIADPPAGMGTKLRGTPGDPRAGQGPAPGALRRPRCWQDARAASSGSSWGFSTGKGLGRGPASTAGAPSEPRSEARGWRHRGTGTPVPFQPPRL